MNMKNTDRNTSNLAEGLFKQADNKLKEANKNLRDAKAKCSKTTSTRGSGSNPPTGTGGQGSNPPTGTGGQGITEINGQLVDLGGVN